MRNDHTREGVVSVHAPDARPDATTEAEWRIRVTAASRLSFTLIDMNGECGRRNGMASLSLARPEFRAVLEPASSFTLKTDAPSALYAAEITTLFQRLADQWGSAPVDVKVESGLPTHSGFGSKSTTLLALGKAYAATCGRHEPTETLARVAERAGTSGGSVNLIDRGGFLVDGGHANPSDFDEEPRRYLVPSRVAGGGRKPPVLIHCAFPPWPILVILSEGFHIHGRSEGEWFEQVLPIPREEARKTAHLVLMNLAPAVAEGDYFAFCRAFKQLTYDTYFKGLQIARQSEAVQTLIKEAAVRPDIDAIGMSSMGPTCFAFTRRPRSAVAWLTELRQAGIVRDFWFTYSQNHPAVIEGLPA